MMNNIDRQLQKIAVEKRIGLMTHVVVGYPTLSTTLDLVRTMADAGVDFVELQIPFSDPLADGPTIQKACEVSLEGGTKVSDAFEVARQLTREVKIPLLFMAYFNTVYKYGVEKFCMDAKDANVSGLIIPDAPLESAEHEGLLAACKQYDLHYIITLAPTSSIERVRKNAEIASGFAYCMTRAGTTGAGHALNPNIAQYLDAVRAEIHIPLAAGFGISKRQHLDMLAPYAEVAVIGSALIDVIAEADPTEITKNVRRFLRELRPESEV
jgi:tryptophan synthase alpha chain